MEEPPPPAREPSPAPAPREESPQPPKAIDHDKSEDVNVKAEGEFVLEQLDTDILQGDKLEEAGEKNVIFSKFACKWRWKNKNT